MAKGRLQIRLTPDALKELERRAGGKDFRQRYIEAWLTDSLPSASTGSQTPARTDDDSSTNSLSPEAKQAREEKKTARRTRKAKLQKNVNEAGDSFLSKWTKVIKETPREPTHLDAVGPTVESGRGKASVEVRLPKKSKKSKKS